MNSASQDEDNPFPIGSSISLLLDGEETPITLPVTYAFTPFTQGQVYLVESQGFPESSLILKVYDPRYLNDRQYENRPWSLAAESLAFEKWKKGEISYNFKVYHLDDDVEEEPWHWEAQFLLSSENALEVEIETYKRLFRMQGQFIPKFYGHGRLLPTPSMSREFKPGAILIEYIPGLTLHAIDPALVLPELYRPLMKAVTRFDSCGVSHLDMNWNNVMLAPPDKPTRMVIIDFGCMVIRQKGETNKEWANSVKADVSHLRISLEQKLGIKLNNDGTVYTPRSSQKCRVFTWLRSLQFSCTCKMPK